MMNCNCGRVRLFSYLRKNMHHWVIFFMELMLQFEILGNDWAKKHKRQLQLCATDGKLRGSEPLLQSVIISQVLRAFISRQQRLHLDVVYTTFSLDSSAFWIRPKTLCCRFMEKLRHYVINVQVDCVSHRRFSPLHGLDP